MAEFLEESSSLESTTVYLWRNAKVVKGGRRFSLSALVVVGDRAGSVGLGYGKAGGAPAAIEKAQKNARKNMVRVTLKDGTIPHEVTGKFCSSKVRLIPAAPGSGVKAGATVRAVLEMAGIHDCLTKAYGSTNQKNLVKATLDGLLGLQTKEQIAALRGVEIESTHVEEIIEAGQRYMPKAAGGEKAKAPVNTVGQKNARGGGRGRGRGRRGEEEQQQQQAPEAAAADQQQETPEATAPAEAAAPAAEAPADAPAQEEKTQE